jgi:hypothetical protein
MSKSHVLHPGSAAKNWYFDDSGERKSICFDMVIQNDRLEVLIVDIDVISEACFRFFLFCWHSLHRDKLVYLNTPKRFLL